MREVMQRVIETEGEAKGIVEAAKAEADRISLDAQMKAQEIVEKARYEAVGEGEKIVSAAVESAEREKKERIAKAVEETGSTIKIEGDTREWAVGEVIRCVAGSYESVG
jgi:vacuolar-type H+-ATPase subunit H